MTANLAIIHANDQTNLNKEIRMFSKRMMTMTAVALIACLGLAALTVPTQAQGDKKKVEKKKEVWTDPSDPSLPADFKFQGEYHDSNHFGKVAGCQVIALGNGTFQAVFLPGGLPGAGWDGKNKILMAGKLEGDKKAVFTPATGKRKYLAQSSDEFSATAKFPPVGQKDYTAMISTLAFNDKIKDPSMIIETPDGRVISLAKTVRKNQTLGQKPPEGAIVLFDGSSKDEFNGGRLDKVTGLLNTDGGDITTKRKFSNYTAHVEFLLPYRPDARGQGRGNSGFYQIDQYEVQILDSFGLEGKDNECGGVYTRLAPTVNMCLPPLQWQTYDVEFTNAIREGDKVVKKARITLKHNGILVHDNAEIAGVTGGARALDKKRDEPEGTPGLLRLQGHGNPLQFKNVWVVEKK